MSGDERPHGVRRPLRLPVGVVLLVVASACGTASDGSASPSTDAATTTSEVADDSDVDPALLMGRSFVSTSSDRDDLLSPAALRISFADGQLTMQAGCNTMFGSVMVEGGQLLVGVLGTTEIGCADDLMRQDGAIAGFIESRPDVDLDGDRLVLSTAQGTLTFTDREVADPDRPLVGTMWTADTLMSNDAVSTLPQGATATLAIADDIAAVSTGCNSGSAPVTITGDVITFGPMTLTEIGCEGDAAALEQIVISSLSGELTFTIDARRLTLTRADGSGLGLSAA